LVSRTQSLASGNAIGDLSVRGLGQMRAAVRLLVEGLDGLEAERHLARRALEAHWMPDGVDGLELLVRVHGLAAAGALVASSTKRSTAASRRHAARRSAGSRGSARRRSARSSRGRRSRSRSRGTSARSRRSTLRSIKKSSQCGGSAGG